MPNPFDDLLPARSQTVTRHANPFDDILPSRTAPPSAVGAFGRSVARSAVPSVTAAGGAGAALTLGAPLIAASGPAAPLTALALGLGGGAVGGIGGAIAQRKALRTFAPQFERRMMAQSQRDVAAHPVAAIAGELAPQILTFRPSVRNLAKAGQAVKLVARGGKLTAEQAAQLANVAGGTAIGAGVEAGGQVARRERFSPGRIALAGAGGGLLNQPTRLGQRLGFRAITPEKTIVFGSHAENVQTQFVDKFAPVAHLTQAAEQAIGRKVIPAENPYQAARLYAGVPGRINVRARELGQILQPLRGQTDDLSRVMVAERNAELTAQGRGVRPGAQIRLRSGQSAPVETMEQLSTRLGPERLTQLQGMARQVTDYNNHVLLTDAVDAGIVSPDAAQAMQARNERYVPFETLETLADDLLEEGGVRFGRQSFQVAKQDVFKRLEGGAQLLEDPLAAQVNKIFKVTTLAERNRVGRTLLTLQRTNPGETQSFIQPLAKDARPPQGMSEFTVFEIGQPVKLAIPTPVADAMKGLTSEAVDFVTKFASLQSRALRSGATTFNVGFAVTNPIRDYQLAALVTRQAGVPFNPMIWARGLFDATLGRVQANSLFDEFERSLAAGSGYFQQQTGRNVGQAGLREIAPTRGQKAFRIAATVLNPAKWIQEIGNAGEQATRLAVFRQARRVGKSPADVAFLTRNSTIDFSRMGTSMKLANMWVPFINARLQGTINTFKAVKGNPLGASYVLTTMIATPALATLAWNIKKFPEIWQDIAQYEKDNNFIFIYGNARASDGRPTQVRKIPKGDVGRIVANPLEQALLFLQGREPQTADQLLMKIASDVSPISFEREGQFSGERLLGSVSPPALQAAEVLTSPTAVDRFSGFPVVPRRLQEVSPQLRRKPTTSATLTRLADTAIGRKLGVSPIQTEAAIGKATAGGGRLLLNLVDKLAFGQNKPGGIFGAAIGYRFAGARGGATEEAQIERAIAMRQRGLDARELRRQQASALLEQLRQHPNDPTQRDRLLRDAQRRDPQVIDKLREIATDEQNGVTTLDRILRTMTIVDRGRFIAEELQRIPTPQERRVFLEGLQRKKLLTPATLEQVRKQRSR